MKKLLFGAMAVLALAGAGCSGSGSKADATHNSDGSLFVPVAPVVETPGPKPAYPGDDPAVTVEGEWAGIAIAVNDHEDCAEAKAYLTPAEQATFTDAECQKVKDFFKVIPSIDWSKTVTSADQKTVTLYDYKGGVFAVYTVGTNGAWYLNSKFWR
ncbi:MAG: hypothetical protein WC802_01640 [Patescibacteria group bacterium]|jgi:hypothetical protein